MNLIMHRDKTVRVGEGWLERSVPIAHFFSKKYNLSFNEKTDVVFTNKEFLKRLKETENRVIIFDEFGGWK